MIVTAERKQESINNSIGCVENRMEWKILGNTSKFSKPLIRNEKTYRSHKVLEGLLNIKKKQNLDILERFEKELHIW